jgi:single-stranded-DNA-specific exonuclease
MERAKLDSGEPLTAEDVAFRIAPRINAPGRLGSPVLALELLLERDPARAGLLADRIEEVVLQRRAQQETIIEEALADIGEFGWQDDPALVVGRRGWNHGVVGIVAGQLAERLRKPVAVVGFDDDGVGRGSVRGPAGSRLHDALSACSTVLERFGGHQAAAGLEVRWERLAELRGAFVGACAGLPLEPPASAAHPECRLHPGDDPARVVQDLLALEPCGQNNPAPRIVLQGRVAKAREVRGGHLKMDLELASGRRIGVFGIRMGDRAETLEGQVVVRGTLRADRWRGGDAVEMTAEALGPSELS